MMLTTALLALHLLRVFVAPEQPTSHDDQALATCAVQAMSGRPSALVLATSAEDADVVVTVGNHAGLAMHVQGTVKTAAGATLASVKHSQKGFDHTLCKQAGGLLDKLAQNLVAPGRASVDKR